MRHQGWVDDLGNACWIILTFLGLMAFLWLTKVMSGQPLVVFTAIGCGLCAAELWHLSTGL